MIPLQGKNIIIPRIDGFMERFETRMKFLIGNNVRLDTNYSGWETIDGDRYDGVCRPIHFENGRLYVLEKEGGGIVVLCGDIADYQERLIADCRIAHYSIPNMRRKVNTYMEKNGITVYSSEVGRHALWVKMMPQSFIRELVKVYEMTKEMT